MRACGCARGCVRGCVCAGVVRLGLKAKEEDLLAGKRTFFVGNGRKAVEYDTSQANTENNFVNFARRYAELWLHQPRTAMEMERVCYKKKSCAVVLTNGKPGQNDLKAIKAVSKMNRLLPVVLIDIAKANFTGSVIVLHPSTPP